MYYYKNQNNNDYNIIIPLAKNSKIDQIVYKDEMMVKQVNGYFILPGGKFGSDALIYEQDPQTCHAKYTLNKTCDNLIGINRLSEKTDKIPLISNPSIKIIRKFRRKTRKDKKQEKIMKQQQFL